MRLAGSVHLAVVADLFQEVGLEPSGQALGDRPRIPGAVRGLKGCTATAAWVRIMLEGAVGPAQPASCGALPDCQAAPVRLLPDPLQQQAELGSCKPRRLQCVTNRSPTQAPASLFCRSEGAADPTVAEAAALGAQKTQVFSGA